MHEVQDYYFNLAKKEGYVARSAYKLQELDQKYHLFGPHTTTVIDIGCAPGSRLQYASRQLQHFQPKHQKIQREQKIELSLSDQGDEIQENKKGNVRSIFGFDLKHVALNLPLVTTFVQDVTDREAMKQLLSTELGIPYHDSTDLEAQSIQGSIDLVISDMAPDTTADKSTDALRSSHMIMQTMWIYEQLLKKNGKFAIKVFMGPGFEDLVQHCRNTRGHKSIKILKPKACRKESKETYIIKI